MGWFKNVLIETVGTGFWVQNCSSGTDCTYCCVGSEYDDPGCVLRLVTN